MSSSFGQVCGNYAPWGWMFQDDNPACQNNTFQNNVVYPGADYLVACWMGRYHGFLGPED